MTPGLNIIDAKANEASNIQAQPVPTELGVWEEGSCVEPPKEIFRL